MIADKDIDVAVAEARALAARLNGVLEVLETAGVECLSVIGRPPDMRYERGIIIDLSRVSLVLDFKPARKSDEGA